MKTHLKIKIKSLAAESRIIRLEEKKWRGGHPMRISLWDHRVKAVRNEARAALLAYGFLRGRTYRQVEPHGTPPVAILVRAKDIAYRFLVKDKADKHGNEMRARFDRWVEVTEVAKAA